MPIYEYKCADCGAVTEFLESMSFEGSHECEKCGSGKMGKMFSVFSATMDGKSIDAGSSCGSCSSGNCSSCGCGH